MAAQNPSRNLRFKDSLKILKTSQTAGRTLGQSFEGDYVINITKYGGSPIYLQSRRGGRSTSDWTNVSFDGNTISFENAGETKIIEMSRNIEYRLYTAVAGSEAIIDIQTSAVS